MLEAKRPYVTAGTLQDYTTHGPQATAAVVRRPEASPPIDEDRIREWLAEMAELVADGELSAKTVNNARTCLSMTLGEAVRRRHIPQNPCRCVPELPVERTEIDYLRLGEIERYLDACADHYRPLAEFLIGTGARISEALGRALAGRRPGRRRRPHLAPARARRRRHGADEGQAIPFSADRAAARRDAATASRQERARCGPG